MTSDAAPATRYDLVTAVWGAEFIELFECGQRLVTGNLRPLPRVDPDEAVHTIVH